MVNRGNSVSGISPMARDVRQGEVLYPIIFSIQATWMTYYISQAQWYWIELPYSRNYVILLSPLVRLLHHLVALCERKFNENNLKFNVLKCTAMRIGVLHESNAMELYDLLNTPIQRVDEVKNLGVVVKHRMNLNIDVHQNKVKYFRASNAICVKVRIIWQSIHLSSFE